MSRWLARLFVASMLTTMSVGAMAQDVRYSWFEISFGQQDIGKDGVQVDPGIGQSVAVEASDGGGIRFRGSIGTWKNLFAYIDFRSTDIDVDAVVSNSQGDFSAVDEFDFTSVSGGVGWRWPLRDNMDVYGIATYDSTDFDFGSLAGEDFDTGEKDFGATLGLRAILKDKIELRAHARYSGVGDVDLTTQELSEDVLYGVGFGYEIVRGLSISADFETGEFSSFNVGFRLDLSED